ncbi:OmpA/MotB family protein [Thiomicrorhabdus arctica]|uniref:OmpA/MotB family protein n=1 Tax=Thiomicrorhabdus arctica TaxID=131540 RepID=UPI00035EDF43|nr:OmpA family protein [Thiomicrorhabdus arctica]
MSFLLLSVLNKSTGKGDFSKSPGLVNSEALQIKHIKASRIWLLTYIGLFTSLLAFFILIITQVELESSTPKRNYQKLVNQLYQETIYQTQQQGLGWLTVENTLSNGVRLTINPQTIPNQSLFTSARAQVNPLYLPYIRKLSGLLQSLSLDTFTQRHQKLVKGIEGVGMNVSLLIRVEGHTDSQPLAPTALFKNNVELSTYRAYAMMKLLRLYTGIAESQFAMSGYGSFHHLSEDTTAAENRRVEIYLLPQVKAKPSKKTASITTAKHHSETMSGESLL